MTHNVVKGTDEVRAEIEAQPRLQPGEPGWWQVWGASVPDIRPGDYVLTKVEEFYVQDTFVPEGLRAYTSLGLVTDGERSVIGRLCPIVLLRPGTRNTLSDSVR